MKYLVIHNTGCEGLDRDILASKGFHSIIERDGSLTILEAETETPYTLDTFSGPSRHILYEGSCEENDMSYKQYDALEIYVNYMILRYPKIKILGHYKIDWTECPSFDVDLWLYEIGVSNKNMYCS